MSKHFIYNDATFSDQFNNWGPAKDSGGGRRVFAEILPAPKNFYLVNLLNCFGAHGGFDLILWYGTRQHLPLKVSRFICSRVPPHFCFLANLPWLSNHSPDSAGVIHTLR